MLQESLIAKLSAGAQSGRATAAEKQLEKMRTDGLIEKPYIAKKRSFTFPDAERMGKMVLSIDSLTHGYQGRTLFKNAQLDLEKGDRVAIIGEFSISHDSQIDKKTYSKSTQACTLDIAATWVLNSLAVVFVTIFPV